MKTIQRLAFLAATLFLFTSCGDSHEKLVKDQLSYMEEMTAIINGVADGKLSSADAAEKIKKWGAEGDEIQKRKQVFIAKNEAREFDAVAEKHADETMKAAQDFMMALQNLQQSGRLTPEIQHAIENVKP